MKDFRKGFAVALSCFAFVCALTVTAFAADDDSSLGLSISFGSGFTSEFGGMGAMIYKSEAAHEKVVQSLKSNPQLAKLNPFIKPSSIASYDGDKGGSLVALIPEVMVRYDVTKFFFVRLGYQGGVRLTGGQWSVNVMNPGGILNEGIDKANYGLWVAGVDQIGNSGKTTFDYKFSSHEIPFVLGLNVPVENGKYNAYAAIGAKYAWYIMEKTVKYSSKATNVGAPIYSDAAPDGDSATTAALMASERVNQHYTYSLHGLAITWLIGVDAKIYENFGAYLEMEFTTNTDSKAKKASTPNPGLQSSGWGGAVSSGTCRYYKVGVKYWL